MCVYIYVRTYVYVVCVSLCYTHMYLLTCIQWNPSNANTNGAEESVLYREVSVFQRLKCMQKVSLLERGVLNSGVSL